MRELREQLQMQLAHLMRRGYDARELIFEPPANPRDVQKLEESLNVRLPPIFKSALLTLSAHVEYRWFAPRDRKFLPPFRSNFSGELHWSLSFTQQFNQAKDRWIEEVFPNPGDPYDAVWHNKLAFLEVPNGDYLAIDLSPDRYEQIVYLSHDDGEGHGYVLADDFNDLLRRWVPLACPGGEDWQWLPFTNGHTSRIDPDCENGEKWREALGLTS